jgi:site-specific DNA-adenine methylase
MPTDFKPELTPAIINNKLNKKPLNYFMTNFDFNNFLTKGASKVVKYGELDDKYNTFEQLLPQEKDYAILLIESETNSGHWVCVLRNKNTFEYFDPYGVNHKQALSFTSQYMNQHLDNTPSDFGTLVKNMKPDQNLIINTTKYQNDEYLDDVATCGRWCMARIQSFLMVTNTNTDFKNFITKQCALFNLPSDVIAVKLVPVELKN